MSEVTVRVRGRKLSPESLHPNTDHDEAYNRAHWHGETWLGIESFHAPKWGAPVEVKSGTISNGRKTATATGKGRAR